MPNANKLSGAASIAWTRDANPLTTCQHIGIKGSSLVQQLRPDR
jgi:hypothetical protein